MFSLLVSQLVVWFTQFTEYVLVAGLSADGLVSPVHRVYYLFPASQLVVTKLVICLPVLVQYLRHTCSA